jgi:hypothetical protein
MADESLDVESKFLKSGRNRRTENAGLAVLLRDARFQYVPRDLKRRMLEALGAPGAPVQAFDAVMTRSPQDPITLLTLGATIPDVVLVEMKTTRKPIRDESLGGFFFGVTESELTLAERLGDRYYFAFVVLNNDNVFGSEFFVLLSYEELNRRIRSKRTQFQVTLGRDARGMEEAFAVGPGNLIRTPQI